MATSTSPQDPYLVLAARNDPELTRWAANEKHLADTGDLEARADLEAVAYASQPALTDLPQRQSWSSYPNPDPDPAEHSFSPPQLATNPKELSL